MEFRESFDSAPITYDDGRPSYPSEAIEWIISKTEITVDDILLEIGSGTGQATIKFAEKGFNIHCVEMGKNLAQLLMQKCKHFKVSVDISSFEEWKPQNSFRTPFIFCANAFHWLDKDIKFEKCSDLLDDDGHLVLLWNVAPNTHVTPLIKAFDLLLEYYPKKLSDFYPSNRKEPKTVVEIESEKEKEIANSGFFTLNDFLEYKWTVQNTRDSIAKGFFSQSMFLSLDEKDKNELSAKVVDLFAELDEIIESDMYTLVYVCKKK